MKCKYIMLNLPIGGEMPILIPKAMPHDKFKAFVPDAVAILKAIKLRRQLHEGWDIIKFIDQVLNEGFITPISAGFVNTKTWQTYGESVGLKLKPRPEDSYILRVFFTMEELK